MTWQLFPYAVDVGVAAVFAMLIWAANERGKVHGRWRTLRHEIGERDPRLTPWCVALGTVAGCA